MAGIKQRAGRDTDPYSPVIVEDMLGSLNEWRNVQDVVRITFKAITDIVKAQGTAIRDLEQQLPAKAAKADVSAQLALKANRTDLDSGFQALADQIETKVGFEDLQGYLEDKVSKGDLQLALRSKADSDQLHSFLSAKADLSLFQRDTRDLSQRLEACKREISEELQKTAAKAEIERLREMIELKAERKEVEKALEEKAGLSGVTSALQRKADRTDVDNLLARKVDMAELHPVLEALKGKADCSLVERLSQGLSTKPDREEITAVIGREVGKLPGKADIEAIDREVARVRTDIEERLQQQTVEIRTYSTMLQKETERLQAFVNLSLSKKADSRSFDYLSSLLQAKVDKEQLTATLASLQAEIHEGLQSLAEESKAVEERDKGRGVESCARLEGKYVRLEEEVGRVKETMRAVADRHKGEVEDAVKYLRSDSSSIRSEFQSQLQSLNQQLLTLSQSKADLSSLQDLRSSLPPVPSDPPALAADLAALKREMSREVEGIRRETEGIRREVESKGKAQREKVDWEGLLREKVDAKVMSEAVGRKAGIEELERLKGQVERLAAELLNKADTTVLESHIQYTRGALQEVGKDLLLTRNLSNLQSSLDQKANIDEVNSALAALHSQLDSKLPAAAFQSYTQEQTLLNEALCGENCLARFIWKSGDLRADSTIPWEVQSVNTCPENYLWEEDRPVIVTVAPGLYEVLIGIFARKSPGIRVLVNGEAVLGIGEQRQVTRHSAGNVAGTTAVEFLALPARARLSLFYSGESGGEGFLGLRKL